jgi:hypothetical protein
MARMASRSGVALPKIVDDLTPTIMNPMPVSQGWGSRDQFVLAEAQGIQNRGISDT